MGADVGAVACIGTGFEVGAVGGAGIVTGGGLTGEAEALCTRGFLTGFFFLNGGA